MRHAAGLVVVVDPLPGSVPLDVASVSLLEAQSAELQPNTPSGVYIFPILAGGTYLIDISAPGFKSIDLIEITLADVEFGALAVYLVEDGGGSDDVWVNFADGDPSGDGSPGNPFTTLHQAVSWVNPGESVRILPGSSADPITISRQMTLISEIGG